MPNSRSFSPAVDRLLHNLRPCGHSKSCWPLNLDRAQSRRQPGESLRQWFVRMVNDFCDGDTRPVALEGNLAVFVRLGWKDRKQLLYANIQTVRATCDLDDYYLGAEAEAIYLRLDFDYQTLGDPFSHPLAHVHLEGDLSPRFALA